MRQHGWFRPHVRGLTAISSTTLREGGGWWIPGSQLDLDFANNRAFNRSTGFNGSPNGILTYTSPSRKLVYGDDGVLRYANHNRLFPSADFTNASWTKTGTSVSADVVTCTAGGTNHRVSQNTSVSGQQRVFFDVKAGTHSFVQIYDGGSTDNYATFNLSSGAVGSVGAATTASITALGDGYYRCAVTYSSSGAPNGNCFLAFAVNAASTWGATFSAVGTETISVLRGQLQSAPAPVDFTYVPTTSAAVYSLPIDHNPTTFEPLGVLIEEQRTNLLTYSEQFDNAAWSKGAVTVSANSVVAPDGTTTADKIVETAATSTHNISQTATIVTATVYTHSVYAKAAERSWVCLEGGSGAGGYSVWFDLATGAVGTISGTAADNVSIVVLPNGWYRCVVTDTSTGTSGVYRHFVCDADNNQSYAGNGTSGLYLWGAQLEAGAFATSYIPTVASQVTRAADQVSILTSAFAYNATAGTFAVEADSTPILTSTAMSLFSSTTTDNDLTTLYFANTVTDSRLIIYDAAGVLQVLLDDDVVPVSNQMKKLAFAFAANDVAFVGQGGAVKTDASVTLGVPTTLKIGANRSSSITQSINGHIKRLTYFSTRKTNAELQALSA